MTARLCAGFREAAAAADVPIQAGALGSMWGVFLAAEPVTDYATAKHADTGRYARLHRALLERGVYLAPSQFEAAFVSLAHTDDLIERTLEAAAGAFRDVAGQG
jgi:glutamate-1-semialdehyde 2,1-aminomutase